LNTRNISHLSESWNLLLSQLTNEAAGPWHFTRYCECCFDLFIRKIRKKLQWRLWRKFKNYL